MEFSTNKSQLKAGSLFLQKHLLKYAQQFASHSGDHLQAAGTLRTPCDTEHTATQEAGRSGLRVQGAVIGKPEE
jgi:hypothetical protein